MLTNTQAGKMPGLTLKAWAVMQGATFVKGMNIASMTKGTAGTYTLNFITPMAGAASYLSDVRVQGLNGQPTLVTDGSRTVSAFTYTVSYGWASATGADITHYIAIYE